MKKDWVSVMLEKAGIAELGLTRGDIFSVTYHQFVYDARVSPLLEIKYFVCDENGKIEEIRTITKTLDKDATIITWEPEHQEKLFEEGSKIHP